MTNDSVRRTTPIVPLDVSTTDAALGIVADLGDSCRFYKIGNELFTAFGPEIVERVRATGSSVFLDLKFHDIPNTVAGGVRNAAKLGAGLVTVHASGGTAMLRAAVEAAGPKCGVLAVTVLTSLSATDVANAWGRSSVDVSQEVLRLSAIAAEVGAHGVVCSGREAALVRAEFGDKLAVLVPGVRPAGADAQDQVRTVTPREAAAAGATYIVVGRPVTGAPDRRAAMQAVNRDLE